MKQSKTDCKEEFENEKGYDTTLYGFLISKLLTKEKDYIYKKNKVLMQCGRLH